MPSDLSEALRSFRTTLLAGALWLGALWLIFGHFLIHAANQPDLSDLLDPLARAFGQVGAAAAVSLAAFMVGALSLQIFRAPSIWITNAAALAVVAVESALVRLIGHFRTRRPFRRYESWRPMAVDLARRLVENHHEDLAIWASSDPDKLEQYRQRAYEVADRQIALELRGPGSEDSYVGLLYHRAAAQLGLVVPVLAFAISLGLRVSGFLFVLVPAACTVGFAAVDYRRDLEAEIETAIWPSVVEQTAWDERRQA